MSILDKIIYYTFHVFVFFTIYSYLFTPMFLFALKYISETKIAPVIPFKRETNQLLINII